MLKNDLLNYRANADRIDELSKMMKSVLTSGEYIGRVSLNLLVYDFINWLSEEKELHSEDVEIIKMMYINRDVSIPIEVGIVKLGYSKSGFHKKLDEWIYEFKKLVDNLLIETANEIEESESL